MALRPKAERLFDLSAGKIRGIEETWEAGNGTPVFTVRAATRRAVGPSGRKGSSSVRPSCSSTPPATNGSSSSGGGKTIEQMAPTCPSRGARPRVQQRLHLRQSASTDARGRIPDDGARVLRAGPEGQRRGASGALDAHCATRGADISIRSTARIRSSSTPCARCARWPWRIDWVTSSWASATRRFHCCNGWSSMPANAAASGLLRGKSRCLRRARTRGT